MDAKTFLTSALLVQPLYQKEIIVLMLVQSVPRNLPSAFAVDPLFLGFILIDRKRLRSLSAYFPEHDTVPPGGASTSRTRLQLAQALQIW